MLKSEFGQLAKPGSLSISLVWAMIIWMLWQKETISSLGPDPLRRFIGDIVNWTSQRDPQAGTEVIRHVFSACLQEAVRCSCARLDECAEEFGRAIMPSNWQLGTVPLAVEFESSTYGGIIWLVFIYLVSRGKLLQNPSGLNSLVDQMIQPVRQLSGLQWLSKQDLRVSIITAYNAALY